MSDEEVQEKVRVMNMRLFETCVKDNTNVSEVFEYLAKKYIQGGGDTSEFAAVPVIGSAALNKNESIDNTPVSPKPSNNNNNSSALSPASPTSPEQSNRNMASPTGGNALTAGVIGGISGVKATTSPKNNMPHNNATSNRETVIVLGQQDLDGEDMEGDKKAVINIEDVVGKQATTPANKGMNNSNRTPGSTSKSESISDADILPLPMSIQTNKSGSNAFKLAAESRIKKNQRSCCC